jgi:hypothetical protein
LQLILDMHFIVEIAVCGRFPYRPVQQLVSAIITRAVAAFSARGVDPQRSVLCSQNPFSILFWYYSRNVLGRMLA